MKIERIKELLEQVRGGQISPDEALEQLRDLPFEDLGFAKIDHHRALRAGMPEVIFGPGKIARADRGNFFPALAARPQCAGHAGLSRAGVGRAGASCRGVAQLLARTLTLKQNDALLGKGSIVIVSAGTSDTPVAEEAAVTAEIMGNCAERIYDVGVAGLHRLLTHREIAAARPRIDRLRRHGGRPAQRGGRAGRGAGDRRPHQHWLWSRLRRTDRFAGHDEFLRFECLGGQYR